ncbi:MAG: hypothetical protein IBX62_08455 [Coriobacteriia bacterium]|nr:hypothetical protein [Coriobacteriia bacterium]
MLRLRLLTVVCVVLGLALVLAGLAPPAAEAATIRSGDSVVIRSGQTIRDDLYVFGSTVDVEGRIDGDLIAFASVVTVDGEVTGDVVVGSSNVDVSGQVGGSVRAGSGNVGITGQVGEDVVAGAGRVRIGSGSAIGRDLLAGTGELNIGGDVGRHLRAGAGSVVVGGTVGGDADVSSGRIRFQPGGRIEGDLLYRSERRQDVPEGAVGGEVTFREAPRERERERGPAAAVLFWFLIWIRGLIGMALLALLVTLLFPYFSLASSEEIRVRPGPSVGIGAALFFGTPFVAMITLIIGIFVGGWWIGLMLLALYLIALAVAVVVAAVFVGSLALRALARGSVLPVWAALLGLLILWLIRIVPILGSIVLFVAMLFGLGAAVITLWETAKRCRAARAAPAMRPDEPLA